MHCIDCVFRRQDKAELVMFYCASPKIGEMAAYNKEYDPRGDRLLYSYEENGTFYVEDNFGCVHFKAGRKEQAETRCICKGFYQPVHCPVHGHKAKGL